jgi:hypothetical protein
MIVSGRSKQSSQVDRSLSENSRLIVCSVRLHAENSALIKGGGSGCYVLPPG